MSVKTTTKNRILMGCLTLVFICLIFIGITLYNGNILKGSKQSDYPTLPLPGMAEVVDTSIEEQIHTSSLIVDATVENVMPDETRVYTPEQGSVDEQIYKKMGISSDEFTVRPIELKINDTLKGSSKNQSITMYISPIALDCVPKFKKGDRLIFTLVNNKGEFEATTLQDGFYYISNDNKVYPAVCTNLLKKFSGMNLGDFKKEVKLLLKDK